MKTKPGLLTKIRRIPQFGTAFFQKLFRSLESQERLIIIASLFVFFASLSWFALGYYLKKSTIVPASGGTYIEGIVGKPEYINPVLSPSNEADSDLVALIFSGLMKYDEHDQLINDIAASWSVNEEKTEYTIDLKNDVVFHDDVPLTAEDVLFTINTIQNARFKSPLRPNWTGVEVRAEGEHRVIFTLKKPFVPFLHNLTFGILPKHIFKDIDPEDFPLSEYNKAPIGSGPYQFDRLEKGKDKSVDQIILKANPHYYLQKPYIETILIKFYHNEEAALEALNQNNVMAINDISHRQLDNLDLDDVKLYEVSLPRYYAVFLNVYHNEFIAEQKTREALSWATCKEQILGDVLNNKGRSVDSPVLTIPMDAVEGFQKRDCSLDKAKEILEKEGWELKDYQPEATEETGDANNNSADAEAAPEEETGAQPQEETAAEGTTEPAEPRQIYFNKNDEPLAITLTTADFPELIKTAELIKQQWEAVGVLVELEVLSIGDLNNSKIEPREYDALLFGQTLGVDPDPRPYWHSGERKSPGQNIAGYNNSKADELLDKGRVEINEKVRMDLYREFQLLINEDIPAIFLYSPFYLYPVQQKVKGIDLVDIGEPAQRFSQIANWYLKEERAIRSPEAETEPAAANEPGQ